MASKLIVNEIEHTDGAGTAVTMAKATITDLTSGTIGSGVTGGSGLTALGTVASGVIGASVTGGAGLDAQVGNQVLLSTQTASNVAGIAFSSSLITDTYDDYILDIVHAVPVTNATHPYLEVSIDNGSNLVSSVKTARHYMQLGTTANGAEGNNESYIVLAWSINHTAYGGGTSTRVLFPGLRSTSHWKHGSFFTSAFHSGAQYAWHGGFECPTTSAINWMNFKFSSGNISSGKFNLYGIKK